MTLAVAGSDLAKRIAAEHPGSVVSATNVDVSVTLASAHDVLGFLKDTEGLDFQFLNAVSAVDYIEYFELIYHLTSLRRNASCVVKTRLNGREELVADTVTDLWKGAELQEREIWDLMGIHFEGHANMKRVLLWEGFPGHPLRKDFIR